MSSQLAQKTPLAKKLGLLVGLGFCAGALLAVAVWLLSLNIAMLSGMLGLLSAVGSLALLVATFRVYAAVTLSLAQNEQKHLQNALVQAKDMLDTSKQLRDDHVLLQSVYNNLTFPVWLKDRFGRYLVVNQTLTSQWCDGMDARGKTDAEVLNKQLADVFMESDQQALSTGRRQVLELKVDLAGQASRWYRIERHPLAGESEAIVGVLGFAVDITGYKVADEQLRADKLTDPVTRFANQQGLRQFIEQHDDGLDDLWCLHVDVDHFKVLNDSMGNAAGDQMLTLLSQRLKSHSRENDFEARVGADEFVLFWYGCDVPSDDDRDERLKDMHLQLNQPFSIGESSYSFTVSIGVARAPGHGQNANELHHHAGIALFNAKKNGRNQVHWYHADYENQAQRRLRKAQLLKNALKQRDLELHLQPRIDCRSGEILALECLARLKSEAGDLIYPGHFIDLAEHDGSIRELDRWMLEQALLLLSRQLKEGAQPMTLGVNLSVQSVNDDTVRYLSDWKARAPEALSYLEIEITEHHLPDKNDAFRGWLESLNSLGIVLALDDFGTGYANLSKLPDLPFQIIKLDQSFIRDLHKSEKQMAVVKAIIDLSGSLSLTVVAEGVETEEELSAVAKLGCHCIQGFFYSRPRPLADTIEWFEQRRMTSQ